MSSGILIKLAEKVTFDSRKSHLIVPGGKKPSYVGVTTITAHQLTVAAGGTATETVLTIIHGLGYAPFVDTYFYPASAQPADPNQYFQTTDSYYKNFFSYISLGSPITDGLTVKVDDVKITVKHTYTNPSAATSAAPFLVNMKYTIYANPGYLQP